MSGTVEGLALLFALGAVISLATARFRVRASAGARAAAASAEAAAEDEAALLARSGHVMQQWRLSPALGGLASACAGCGGICVITADEIIHNLPLIAMNGELAACPASSRPGRAAPARTGGAR